ncbi:hypothetical protein W97_04000 [Coniosporium apollinis CBS 100218]|uniref:Apoptosis-inducing TAF9-like domain 1 family protein n=1 Tax=Coniosporium apollinis (strain CBS 100218) TaxID=1168221 RepID=R7YS59_CONA1|nr:uncharacterized protein W97_04000 [Coniosporium apollinis CBS 100218]EON64767.1 hypothetical protein W97_04000 [Coniosporium apollinis CBS 100218]
MALPDDDAAQREEQLKSALWYSLGQYIDDECLRQNWNVTPQFIGALTEMVFAQIATTAKDLETFAAHAGRTTINTSDVLLLARRNDGLESVLKTFVDEHRAANGTSGGGAGAPRARAAAPSTRGKSVRGRGRGRGRGKS